MLRSHQALLELPGRLYYANELVPCAPAPLVSGCLQFPGLTEAARGVTPIIVHGVVGQVSSTHHEDTYKRTYDRRNSFIFYLCVCEIKMLYLLV